ncbi:MAG TPA: creatininase family protein [Opitutaceae bacterium]
MTRLANVAPAAAWEHYAWSEFAELPGKERALAVLPVYGFADHGLGQPLDVEEVVGNELLHRAVRSSSAAILFRILPPLRFALAPYPHTFFGVDPETAHDLIREIATSVQAAGFRKLVFFSTSPWNEELVDAASRDSRANLGLQTFVINLSGLGLDFHPTSDRRAHAQAAAAHVLGAAPKPVTRAGESRDVDFRPGCFLEPAPTAADPSLPGAELLEDASQHLGRLFAEIDARAPLNRKEPHAPLTLPAHSAPPFPPSAHVWPDYRPRYLAGFTRDELAALPGKDHALVIVPTGAIEQHGHHLPVGVDALLGQAWLERALPKLPVDAPVFVAPPITYGKSNEHLGFPGTVYISAKTLRRLLLAIAAQLHALGFRRIALLNTHGGNSAVLVYTLREIQTSLGVTAGMLGGYARPVLPLQEAEFGFHAGEWETSLMLACNPELVRMDRALCEYPARVDDPGELRPENAPAIFSWITSDVSVSGVMGDATVATGEKGRQWFDEASTTLAGRIEALLG